MYVIKSKEIQI